MFALAHSVSAKPLMEYYSGDIQFTLPPPVLSAGPGTNIDVHFCEEIFKHRNFKMLEENYLITSLTSGAKEAITTGVTLWSLLS